MKSLLLSFCILLASLGLSAQAAWWQDAAEPQRDNRTLFAKEYRVVRIQPELIEEQLMSAPHENDVDVRTSPLTLELPLPDGESVTVRFVHSPSCERELEEKFPNLRTYAGMASDGSAISVRFSLTDLGFHAWIDTPEETIYIDPLVKFDREYCMVYTRSSFFEANPTTDWTCLQTGDKPHSWTPEKGISPTGKRTIKEKPVYQMGRVPAPGQKVEHEGMQLKAAGAGERKDYVVAIASTGEYADDYDGTVAGSLAGIAVTLNRVNGVYGRDCNVRMFLSGDNDEITYTNAATDPYNNTSSSWVNQNQSTIDAEIGNSNYDVGHLFRGAGSGGFAPGDVCNNSNKAKAYTARNTPQGDPFDIDYVALNWCPNSCAT